MICWCSCVDFCSFSPLFLLPIALTGCMRTAASSVAETKAIAAAAAAGDQSGAAADGVDSAAFEDAVYGGEEFDAWENPYLTVQGGMVTLHVMQADANTSDLGVGGMLRPTGRGGRS